MRWHAPAGKYDEVMEKIYKFSESIFSDLLLEQHSWLIWITHEIKRHCDAKNWMAIKAQRKALILWKFHCEYFYDHCGVLRGKKLHNDLVHILRENEKGRVVVEACARVYVSHYLSLTFSLGFSQTTQATHAFFCLYVLFDCSFFPLHIATIWKKLFILSPLVIVEAISLDFTMKGIFGEGCDEGGFRIVNE